MNKPCKACGVPKPSGEFYLTGKGRRDSVCKACRCTRVRENRRERIAYYQEYDRGRAMLPHRVEARDAYSRTPEGKAAHARAHRSWLERNPVKRAAQIAAGNAIRDGRIKRQPCEVCGETRAQAHHDDYGKPLDVRWLCTTHHAEWHRHNTPKCPPQTEEAA